MAENDSFTDLMNQLRGGDDTAAAKVFHRYASRLIGLARSHLGGRIGRKVDPEDVVQSVYKSFFLRYGQGQFEVVGWDSLWRLLTTITLRKCANHVAYLRAGRRDAGREVSPAPATESGQSWEAIDREPTPEEAAVLAETVEQLLRGLDPADREVIELSLQGYTTQEISAQLGRAERTVRRVRELVKKQLERLQCELDERPETGSR